MCGQFACLVEQTRAREPGKKQAAGISVVKTGTNQLASVLSTRPVGVALCNIPYTMSLVLYIVRHAKAEDRSVFGSDHDRELIPEGIMAAARVGRFLHTKSIRPEVLISSTAHRARDTAKVMAEQLGIDPATIQLDAQLFDGGPKAYLAAVNALPDSAQSAMLVGHNPDVSYFAEFLTHQSGGSMRKGAVVAVTFEGLRWAEVSGRTGSVSLTTTPGELPKEA